MSMDQQTTHSNTNKELQARLALLKEISFFKLLTEKQLVEIAKHLKGKTFNPGEKVLTQDQAVDGVYFLQQGEVQILVSNEQTGQEELITHGFKGEVFGEMSTLRKDIPASASVVSARQSKFLFINRHDFLDYVNRFNLWSDFVNILSSRLEQTNHRMTEVMKHLKQGMVQVDTRGKITGKFSMGFVRLIGREISQLNGESFPGLVFKDCQDSMRKWTDNFSLAIMSNPQQAELILDLLPNECTFHHPEKGSRIFGVSYDLCIYQKKVIGMDIGIEDITRVRELAQKSADLEKEKKVIGEIYTKPETFRTLLNLISEIRDNLVAAETAFQTQKIKKEDCRIWLGNMHSLKGTAYFLQLNEIGEAAHQVEDVLSALTTAEASVSLDVKEFKSSVSNLERHLSYVDQVLTNMGEETRKRMTAEVVMSQQETDYLEKALVHDSHAFSILQKARKIPSQKLVEGWKQELERLCIRLSKKAIFRTHGESIPIPGNIFKALKVPLLHILRNCAEHGIESNEERKKIGKPSVGLISFKAELSETQYLIHIQDNGRGIDKNKVKEKAHAVSIQKPILKPQIDSLLAENKVFAILFLPGFSTSDEITDISGRGVGLDVVQKAVISLGGTISMKSLPGKGTKFTLCFPR